VLTKLEAYSSWLDAPTLALSDSGREETDLIQIRAITGLDPVKATVNTSPFGSVDGVAYIGSNVAYRNPVLTLHPNPDWDIWSFESLRRLIYKYFMPKLQTRLVFYSDDMPPVEIYGYVEDTNVNQFSKDPEIQVSIICPDPYFTAIDPTIVTGQSDRDDTSPAQIEYNGDIATGINVEVTRVSDPVPTSIGVQIGDPSASYFNVAAGVDSTKYFAMNSIPGNKFVQTVSLTSGVITNLLSKIQDRSTWPTLQPGTNNVAIITDQGVQDWQLTYYERYGGL
jgi:Phage tail protein